MGQGNFGAKTIVGLCMLCALVFSALAAQSSSAATKGTTAFTCSASAATKTFKTEHCKASDGAGSSFGHTGITANTTTEIAASNETTEGLRETVSLTSVQAGLAQEIQARTVTGTGTMVNKVSGSEPYTEGEGKLEYKELEVTKPSGKGCKVKGSEVVTKQLSATTEGQGDFLKFTPKEGSVFAEFELEGCTGSKAIESLNGIYTVTGSVKGVPNGATVITTGTETTTQDTLSLRGQKAGINGPLTVKGRANSSESFAPLSATTAEETPPPSTGTTAFTCGPASQPNSLAGFSKSHCKSGDAVGTNAAYRHTAASQGAVTEVIGSNKNTGAATETSTPMRLRATTAGIDTEFEASGVSATGTMENMKDATSGEHTISGTGTVTFTGVSVVKPEGKGCKVKGGEVKSKELKATTAGQGDAVKFEAASGSVLASFEVEGCSTEALNGTFEVKGSIKGTPDGATVNFTEEGSTVQNTMTMRSVPAGLEGSVTIAGRAKESGSNYTDLSPTTVST